MPATCKIPGLRFQYPENWTIDEEDEKTHNRAVTVYSPSGAFWSVARYPDSADPTKLARSAVEAMREEYDSLEVHEAGESIAGHELVGYDLFFYCLDLTNTAQVRATTVNEATYVVFYQAEDREFDRIGPVFRAIATSLFQEM